MDANHLEVIALVLGAIGVLLLAGLAVLRMLLEQRSEKTLLNMLDQRAATVDAAMAGRDRRDATARSLSADDASNAVRPRRFGALSERAARIGVRWLDTPFGQQLVAPEDRRLLDQCGYADARARGLFLYARIAGAVVLALGTAMVMAGRLDGGRWIMSVIVAIVVGFMVPKVYIRRRAASRRQSVSDELPLLIDMLRLLQGVGLSLDQSIQVVTNDFKALLPVLAWELSIAQRQFAAGRTREQALQRLASSFDNEDLYAIVRLLVQVDKHGGAVQEPLKQFGERLRDGRRASLRERIGRLTVKMTGVMILTLLPALMIVTAGPGVMAVTHALAAMRH